MKKFKSTVAFVIVLALASFGMMPAVLAQQGRAYRNGDRYMKQLIRRIETRSDRFSNSLEQALDRSRWNGTSREDGVNRLVTEFEHATDQLKDHFNGRRSTAADVENVLTRAAVLNTFMRENRLTNRAERDWTLLKRDLDSLASAYSVAWNWDTMMSPGYSTNALLTGTFRLNTALSDNPRTVADNATRYLPSNQRQRVSDNLINRLTPPEMLSIERRGQNVMLASTRSPQVTFDADGQEHRETYPNGRVSNVRAHFSGNQLSIVSNGDRLNDFTATFATVDNGRRLLVTRSVYAERINQPVVVRSYYDRTSDVAEWNIYNPNAGYTSVNNASGQFVVPDGTQLVAVLNNDLSTRNTRDNERFTMTVRSPAQYDGAVIEGYVSNVNRSGRITGRSEMTLNFDSIRLRNGGTYRFAGLVENALASNGEAVRLDNEGAIEESSSRTSTTTKRTAIGGAIGALIGAIAGGGSGAAIGAIVGAGAGAGSVYIQGSDDLQLKSGTQFTIRSSAPAFTTAR